MKPNRFRMPSIDIIVALIGVICVLISGYIDESIFGYLFRSVGTAFIAAGVVSLIITKLHTDVEKNYVEIIAPARHVLLTDYKKKKFKAKHIDIVGVALSSALQELASDDEEAMFERVLFGNANLRMCFLSPLSIYVKQRAVEDNVPENDLKNTLRQSLESCETIYTRFNNMYLSAKGKGKLDPAMTGSFEIKIIDYCPYFTLYRTDDQILWGLYTSETRGINSAVLKVLHDETALFNQLTRHFEALWRINIEVGDNDANYLLSYVNPNEPVFNHKLKKALLIDA